MIEAQKFAQAHNLPFVSFSRHGAPSVQAVRDRPNHLFGIRTMKQLDAAFSLWAAGCRGSNLVMLRTFQRMDR